MLAYYKVEFFDAKKKLRVAHLHIAKAKAGPRKTMVEAVLTFSRHGFSSVKRITEEKK